MTTIEFVDTPPGVARASHIPMLEEFANALRANPGRWAKYPLSLTATQASSLSCRINAGRKPGTPIIFMPDGKGSFQSIARRGRVYARFVKSTGRQRKRAD
jgi:hypothetical protein